MLATAIEERHGGIIRIRDGGLRRLQEIRMSDAVNIAEFLHAEGFTTPESLARARDVIEAAGLTRGGKRAILASKLLSVRATLLATLLRACSDACVRIDRDGPGRAREVAWVAGSGCEICGGSNNVRAAIEMLRTLRRKRIKRVVIVGGTSNQWREVSTYFAGAEIDVKYIDGTKMHSAKDALANKRWAQLIIIWAPTPLHHAVSSQYTHGVAAEIRVVTVNRRGIEALCDEVRRSYT